MVVLSPLPPFSATSYVRLASFCLHVNWSRRCCSSSFAASYTRKVLVAVIVTFPQDLFLPLFLLPSNAYHVGAFLILQMPSITRCRDHVSTRGGHNTPRFESWRVRFFRDSTKTFFRRCLRSYNYRNKDSLAPDTNIVSSEESQQPTQDTTTRIDDHKHTEITLVTDVEQARPKAHYPHPEAAYFGAPALTDMALPMVPAARPASQYKMQPRPRLRLSDVALQVLMIRAVKSTGLRRTVLRIQDYERSHAPPTLALVLCVLSKCNNASVDSDEGVCGLIAKATWLRPTTLSLPFDPASVLLDDHRTCLQLPASSDVADLDDTYHRREHAPSHGKPPASTGQKRHITSREAPRRNRKRPCPDTSGRSNEGNGNNEDDDDEDERRTNQAHPGGSLPDQDERLFACPFYKHDPFKYRLCLFRQRLTATNYVRQHLRRYHLSPMHCPTCGGVFRLQSDLDGHIRERTCQIRDFSHPGLSQVQREALEKNLFRNYAPEERWYKMWEIIFPNVQRPASPYLKDAWIEVIENNFDIWIEQGGPGRMNARGGPTIPRPEPDVQDLRLDGTTSVDRTWEAVKMDMIEFADKLVHPRSEPESHTANQQLEQQSDCQSGYEIVSPSISDSFTQVQSGPASISVPRSRPGYSYDHLTPAYITGSVYYAPSTSGSTNGMETLGGAGASTSQGARPGPLPSLQYQQSFSDAYQTMPANQSFHHTNQGQFVPEVHEPTPALAPAFHAQLSRQAPPMANSLSHSLAPEQTLLGGMRGVSGDVSENVEGLRGTVPGASQGRTLGGAPGSGGVDDVGFFEFDFF